MDDLRDVIRDYVVREYVEEGTEIEITNDSPLITGGVVGTPSRWCR